MDLNTKGCGKIICLMVMVHLRMQMVQNLKEILLMDKYRVKEDFNILIMRALLVNLKTI